MSNFSEAEKKLLKLVQGDIPVVAEPFAAMAKSVGMSEEEVLSFLTRMRSQGVIKRMGALIRHQKSGFTANAMVVWELPPEKVAGAGKFLAQLQEVSHCYEREPAFLGRFNFFTMLHLKEANFALIAAIAQEIGALDYQILHSERELKKTSREYFT
ncbi:MAG: Lrp/AsnC family transcriptional regulator [Deltaproteobacteria bacterium]|nr:Lrp/AsnC family transcriptional regulator [Deltaproteobacteria bacterium]